MTGRWRHTSRLAGPPAGRVSNRTRGGQARRLNLIAVALLSVSATTAPTSTPTDPALWAEMRQVDATAGRASAVSAKFRQEKFTPLLKRPLVSTGHVFARGDTSLWTTAAPRPSAMRVTTAEIRIYYPDQSVVEVYPVQGQLGALAASPLPRLDVLAQFFTFEKLPTSDADVLDLKLTPSTDDLRQHVRQVVVKLDRRSGAIRRAETTDADGDRTVLTFDRADLHAAVTDADLALAVPAGTREAHPMAGVASPDGR